MCAYAHGSGDTRVGSEVTGRVYESSLPYQICLDVC